MASGYVRLGSDTTVRVLSQTDVIDVQAVKIRTTPSGVFCVVPVPLADFNAGHEASYLQTTADLVEGILGATPDPGQTLASSAIYVQTQDASGLLAGFLTFKVAYVKPGSFAAPFTQDVTIPMTSFETAAAFDAPLPGGTPLQLLEAAYANVKRVAHG